MNQRESDRKAVGARIVVWGPPAAGKTAMLASLRNQIDPEDRLRLYSIAAEDGSTLAFDLLALDEFHLGAQRVRAHVVAAPGNAACAAAARELLVQCDAVVFVGDSTLGGVAANRASLRELFEGLRAHGHDPASVPVVWAFNRQDHPDVQPTGELRRALLDDDAPAFETVATEGRGVLEVFSEALRRLCEALARRHGVTAGVAGDAAERVLAHLRRAAANARRVKHRRPDRTVTVDVLGRSRDAAGLAVEAQLRVAETLAQVDASNFAVEARNAELMAVNRIARSILSAMEVNNLLVVLLDAVSDHLDVTHLSCVVFDPSRSGALKTHVLGFGRDPVLRLPREHAKRFFDLIDNSDGPIVADEKHNPDLFAALRQVDRRVLRAVYQSVRGDAQKPNGWIGVYRCGEDAPLTTRHLLFLSSIARLAALGLGKIELLDRLQTSEASLREEVQEGTGRLEMAEARIRALNRGLESRVTERTRSLEEANKILRDRAARTAYDARLRGMGDLAAAFAHEINNPVAGLRGNLEFMHDALDELRARLAHAAEGGDGVAAVEEFDEVIGECRESAGRISSLIASLKRFGGETEAGDGGVALNALVADAVTLLEERLHTAAELDLRLGTLPDIDGDALELSHVVLALLTNAVEAVERHGGKGAITVTTFAGSSGVTLMVKDTGGGVDPALLERVFEPFVSTKEEPSAGLGLHSAFQTVEKHGGVLRLRSRPGQGTTATVELPQKATATAAPAAAPAAAEEA